MAKRNQKILVTHLRVYLWQDTQVAEFRGWRESKSGCRDHAFFFANEGEKREMSGE
jgi:hypothetical protein